MLRFFTVYGPRQRPDLAIRKFATLIHAGQPVPVFGDGRMARDYTYVTDTVDGIMAATQKEFGFEIFNLGESQTVTLGRLIELLEAALGKKAVIDRQPVPPGDVPLLSPTSQRRAPGWAIIRGSKSRRASIIYRLVSEKYRLESRDEIGRAVQTPILGRGAQGLEKVARRKRVCHECPLDF